MSNEKLIHKVALTIYQIKIIRNYLKKSFEELKKFENYKHSLLLKLPYVYFALFLFSLYYFINLATLNSPVQKIKVDKYNVFTASPLDIESTTTYLHGVDARAKKIDGVFKTYGCPMYGTGEYIVEQADKNGIPYWLVAAVAFQESLCGKYTPEKGGVESYNSWGWGVYGTNAKFFKSYEHGIKVVSEYFSNRFYKRGIKETCEIMRVYTPPSNGSWCKGVNYFGEKIQNYGTR
jgi:hypothetical protein